MSKRQGSEPDGPGLLIHALYNNPLSGKEIEARSFAIIDREAPEHAYSDDQWEIVRRMIHTTADFDLINRVKFSADAIDSGVESLKAGSTIFSDSNMIRSGLSLARLQEVSPRYGRDSLVCYVADDDVALEARKQGLPRSLFAVRKARSMLEGGIAVFGNAPVAVMELNRLIVEEGVRPGLVVAMPVGFVHVVECKEELMSLDVPFIVIEGRRGGSPLAVSVIHALCSVASKRKKEEPMA